MARSLNRVQLIGNLTRDPELRYTPSGAAVCSFGIATNRSWTTDTGEKHEETEFHNLVAWNKLAEICSQFLTKGRKVFVEGRLATRKWTTKEGQDRSTTEIVISDMILLDNKGVQGQSFAADETQVAPVRQAPSRKSEEPSEPVKSRKKEEPVEEAVSEVSDEIAPDDIPF
jgi:single-strand DNA-binding protein